MKTYQPMILCWTGGVLYAVSTVSARPFSLPNRHSKGLFHGLFKSENRKSTHGREGTDTHTGNIDTDTSKISFDGQYGSHRHEESDLSTLPPLHAAASPGTTTSKRRPNWLRIPPSISFSGLKESVTLSFLAEVVQYGLLAFLVAEIVGVFKEVAEGVDSSSGSRGPILSPRSVRKIITYLKFPQEDRQILPLPSVSPPWMLNMAADLKSCHSISFDELERILKHITKPQAQLLQSCLSRPSKRVSFDEIGGIYSIKMSIQGLIRMQMGKIVSQSDVPLSPYDRFVSSDKKGGIVLWGPPGCGKSLLLQAAATTTGLPTLVVTPSLIMNKYFGESSNRVRTLFDLLSLLGPSVLVLDELDGLFRARAEDEHQVTRDIKTEWLQWWDGVASSQLTKSKTFVMAATNRPWDVDAAVWRRLPYRFYVGVPTVDDRRDLVSRWVKCYELPSIHPQVIESFANVTEGYIPSDLHQILQLACRFGPMARGDTDLTTHDIQIALSQVSPTRFSMQYVQAIRSFMGIQEQQHHQQYHRQGHGHGQGQVGHPNYYSTHYQPPNGGNNFQQSSPSPTSSETSLTSTSTPGGELDTEVSFYTAHRSNDADDEWETSDDSFDSDDMFIDDDDDDTDMY